MGLVRTESPVAQYEGPGPRQGGEAGRKVRAIGIVPEEDTALPALHHPVVDGR